MDYCHNMHERKYLITCNGTRTHFRNQQWMMCEYCYKNKEIFNDPEQVESVTILA